MKDTVRDFVFRMCGDAEVAAICAAAVGGLDGGDVCVRLRPGEAETLRRAPCVATFAEGSTAVASVMTPFVVVGELLYTRRNWSCERNVADRIAAMAGHASGGGAELPDTDFYRALREEQRMAVQAMCGAQFSILTGGPGTGKTFTIDRAVRFLQESNPGLRLGLAAPTGKAAAKMGEGLKAGKAVTIHSMLGANLEQATVRFDRANPLAFDWVIVDEASMIGLSLMSKLLDALPKQCRLTLSGDEDQLASVDRGRVFGDLCRRRGVTIARLRESTRFAADGGIARLAAAVNGGRCDEALAILKAGDAAVKYADLAGARAHEPAEWPGFEALVQEKFAAFRASRNEEEALAHVDDFRVLCAVREGPYGVGRMNEFAKALLGRECPTPVMVTRNDFTLDVSNGDVGVVMPGDEKKLYLAKAGGGIRTVRLELLPETETAFASTVHKSQGSEFMDVAMVLPVPGEGEHPLLTREILYTGITRTKKAVHLFGNDAAVRMCCARRMERMSGMCEKVD